MKLSDEDIRVLELEKQILHFGRLCAATNNTEPQCTRYHNKAMAALREQSTLLYDAKGDYRKDRKHLLAPNAGYLNLKLLEGTL